VGIRDFIQCLEEHRRKLDRLENGAGLSDEERREALDQAEMMVGMADAAVRELESVLRNRRINLPEEHAVRFAQDIFLHLREEEKKVKEALRKAAS
jgi:phenylalanyl-tRNA synthetase alpha subunit